MLYARIAEEGVSSTQRPITDPNVSVFLGEAFSLTYVIHDVLAPFLVKTSGGNYQRRLHYPLTGQGTGPDNTPSRSSIAQQQTEYLRSRDLLFKPNQQTLLKLIDVYFGCFHPAFPMLNREDFKHSNISDASQLLVNAVLMISVTICERDTLDLLRLQDRYSARSIFYHQAKAIFDADREPDKVSNVVGAFLMSFWWGGPDDQKDSWHWMGIATSLAQSLGMHRSAHYSGVGSNVSKSWKRIWWSIRERDAMVSGSIGRPMHMSEYDCDVELLTPGDVHEVMGNHTEEQILYSSQMAHLCTIFSKIINSRYSPSAVVSRNDQLELEQSLADFRRNIPPVLEYTGVTPEARGLWSAMLLMAYNYATILLCRPPRSMSGQEHTEIWGNSSKAFFAANEVTRVMEDILSASIGRLCQIHT